MLMNVATASSMNTQNAPKNTVSTVSTAAASTSRNEMIAR